MTEVMDVRAVQSGSWWMVTVPGMPGLMAQVSSLEPRHLSAALAASSAADVADITVRRVQVAPAAPVQSTALDTRRHDRGAPTWAEQAAKATRLAPRRVAELLAS
jgi:beta-phosphoglucomutase-like phosphatase (HAD superfamily)